MAQPDRPIDIYARVSQKGDKEQRSVPGQVRVCRDRLAGLGLAEGNTYKDDGKSAWNPKVVRADWEALMGRLESGVSGGVIVFDLERFTRRPREGERLIDAAERGLVVLDSDAAFDLTTASGKKAFRDAMAAAAYYSDRLSDRVRRGIGQKKREGQVNRGGLHRPFGFEDDALTVREDEAEIIRMLTAHFLHGDPQDALVRHLNRAGVPTASGGQWSVMGLRHLLTRERNRGNIIHRGVPVARLPGEPVIGDGEFERVLARYAARRPGRPPSPAYLCTGTAVCGLCGRKLSGRPRNPRCRPYPDGSRSREYWCSPSTNGGCGKLFIDQRALDELALELVVAILSDPRNAARIEAAAADSLEAAAGLDASIARDEQLLSDLDAKLARHELTWARWEAITATVAAGLADLRARRGELDDDAGLVRVSGIDWRKRVNAADHAEKRAMLRMALQGRTLVVGPPAGPRGHADAAGRVTLGKPPREGPGTDGMPG